MTGGAVPAGVDHLVYGTPDLERAVSSLEDLLGARAKQGGRHPRYGTRNALLSLGGEIYLEIIAPDRESQRPDDGRLFALERADRPRLVTWALRREEIDAAVARASEAGTTLGKLEAGRRQRPDGTVLKWRLTDLRALPLEGAVPFLISWGATPHPARTAPEAGVLVGLRMTHPRPEAVVRSLEGLGVTMNVQPGRRFELIASIRTRGGPVVELR